MLPQSSISISASSTIVPSPRPRLQGGVQCLSHSGLQVLSGEQIEQRLITYAFSDMYSAWARLGGTRSVRARRASIFAASPHSNKNSSGHRAGARDI